MRSLLLLGFISALAAADGHSAGDIDRVIRSRAGAIRACYQKELNRVPGLAGKIVVQFVIADDGNVASARIASSTMKDAQVESCITRQIMRLKFRPTGTKATVNYPFIFAGK